MRPETVLNLDYNGDAKSQLSQWLSEYTSYLDDYPEKEEIIRKLISRAELAYKLYEQRLQEKRESLRGCSFHDDSYYIETARIQDDEDSKLDGDFPLGNESDAVFVSKYFSVSDLVKIQLGFAERMLYSLQSEQADNVLIKKGILNEMTGQWKEAECCYCAVQADYSVQERALYCRRKAEDEGEKLYQKGMELIEELNWNDAWYPLYNAAELEHTEAMAEIGYMCVYGIGCSKDIDEGLTYLRRSAEKGSNYACYVLWEMHDDGVKDIKAAEAKKWCEQAAGRGDIKAKARLEEGFDLRPVTEILQEQIDKGNIDALWYMAMELDAPEDDGLAMEYVERAADAGQIDALLFYAELYSDPSDAEFYDEEKADEYYRKAAEKGCETAILALGDRALRDIDVPFWKQAADSAKVTENIREQHKAQFAWYLLAAQGGCVRIMPHIATAYHYGYPCEKNDEQAFLWASRAADAGDSYAMYQIGYFYENALGCEKDMTVALLFYIQAAEGGVLNAMYRLIDIYTNGKDGIPADKEKANRYRFMSGVGRE